MSTVKLPLYSTPVLQKELVKARKRLSEQEVVVANTVYIIESALALPSLKRIAAGRLPKLTENLEITRACVAELEKALEVPVQTDIETPAPSRPLVRGSKVDK